MHYKSHSFRLSDELYEDMKNERPQNMSWNQFILRVIKKWKKHKNAKKLDETHECGIIH